MVGKKSCAQIVHRKKLYMEFISKSIIIQNEKFYMQNMCVYEFLMIFLSWNEIKINIDAGSLIFLWEGMYTKIYTCGRAAAYDDAEREKISPLVKKKCHCAWANIKIGKEP
jgi:hypothetical protein